MTSKMTSPKSRWFETTVGEFVEAVYEAAMEEYMNEGIARRIAMQMLIRKLRLQHKMTDVVKKPQADQKKAYLRSELNKRRAKKA
jgi:hypothetical protein